MWKSDTPRKTTASYSHVSSSRSFRPEASVRVRISKFEVCFLADGRCRIGKRNSDQELCSTLNSCILGAVKGIVLVGSDSSTKTKKLSGM